MRKPYPGEVERIQREIDVLQDNLDKYDREELSEKINTFVHLVLVTFNGYTMIEEKLRDIRRFTYSGILKAKNSDEKEKFQYQIYSRLMSLSREVDGRQNG